MMMLAITLLVLLYILNIVRATTSGYLYINVNDNETCSTTFGEVIHQYGWITNQCVMQFNSTTGKPIGSLYASCNAQNGTVQYFNSTNCQSGTQTSSFFNNLTSCYSTNSSAYLSSIGPAYTSWCDTAPVSYTDVTSNNMLVMDSAILTYFYDNSSSCNSNVVSFSSIY